jgi:hypothetical protein
MASLATILAGYGRSEARTPNASGSGAGAHTRLWPWAVSPRCVDIHNTRSVRLSGITTNPVGEVGHPTGSQTELRPGPADPSGEALDPGPRCQVHRQLRNGPQRILRSLQRISSAPLPWTVDPADGQEEAAAHRLPGPAQLRRATSSAVSFTSAGSWRELLGRGSWHPQRTRQPSRGSSWPT